MHKLKSIAIKGFRGQKSPIQLKLSEDANFLIGRNGTGKTTLINLIHAGLALDIAALREGRFDSIEFTFKGAGLRRTPKISISKTKGDAGTQITYVIQPSAKEKAESFPLMRVGNRRVRTIEGRHYMMPEQAPTKPLRDRLAEIYRTTWLSLQRRTETIDLSDGDYDEDDRGTDVDQKLEQVLNALVRYFSRLDNSVAEQTRQFQRRWFLSFLAADSRTSIAPFQKLNLDDERATLESIFEKFEMDPESYKTQLDNHFKLARGAKNRQENDPIDLRNMFAIFDSLRLHTLVEEWQALQEAQRQTYLPKIYFIKIASDMLFKKAVQVNRSNQVTIISDTGDIIPNRSLSSGEKQLLIFLTETLLQENEPYIFLADEPELSLHVEWQEELVPNLFKINPNAQVLFATHSPDIVNVYQDNVTEMEKITD
jgi:ABC-type lipoprotein export system ATPase subunit